MTKNILIIVESTPEAVKRKFVDLCKKELAIPFKQVDARWLNAVLNSEISFSETKCDNCGKDLPFDQEYRVVAVRTDMKESYALGKVDRACLEKLCIEQFHWTPKTATNDNNKTDGEK